MDDPRTIERRALTVSIGGAAFMMALGFGFAWLTGSEAILLDGAFSGLGVVMAVYTRKVADLQRNTRGTRFHFGYAAFTPFTNTLRALATVVLAGFALAGSVRDLLEGGREMEAGLASVYGLIAAAGCFSLAVWTGRRAKLARSPLVDVDARSWWIDGALSAVVAVAFAGARLMEGTSAEPLVPYVDPALVVILVLAVAPVPVRVLVRSVEQLLLGAPPEEEQWRVRARFDELTADLPVQSRVLSMVRLGHTFYVTAHVVVDPGLGDDVASLDHRRERIEAGLTALEPDLVIDVIFTADPKWVP
jgi:predicted Co/Zn/Cd cation transporter (cation efflux family)